MKYIDAEKLKAEIERLLKCTEQHRGEAVADGSRQTLYWIKDFIDSLQQKQPEVDLEKEYQTWWNSISGKINVEHIMEWYMHETARHFYELGLNARKEE